ncbi:MAG: CvpA family protein [Planctomycetota bacterium]
MSVVDIIVLVLLSAGFVVGVTRGLLLQITGVVGFFGGIFLAARYHVALQHQIIDRLGDSGHNGAVAFISIVVLTVLWTALLITLLKKAIDHLHLGTFDRVAGGMFGALKAAMLCSGILLLLLAFADAESSVSQTMWSSRSGPRLWQGMEQAAEILPIPEHLRARALEHLAAYGPPPSMGEIPADFEPAHDPRTGEPGTDFDEATPLPGDPPVLDEDPGVGDLSDPDGPDDLENRPETRPLAPAVGRIDDE